MVQRRNQIGILETPYSNSKSIFNTLNFLKVDTLAIINKEDLNSINKIIIPGIGNFTNVIRYLEEKNLINALINFYKENNYILSICLGMQLMCLSSEEGDSKGIGIIKSNVSKFRLNKTHIGWNKISLKNNNPLFKGLNLNENFFYFVHNYFVDDLNTAQFDNYSISTYENRNFISFFQKKKLFAFQFHPEKSQKQGLKLINNFVNL